MGYGYDPEETTGQEHMDDTAPESGEQEYTDSAQKTDASDMSAYSGVSDDTSAYSSGSTGAADNARAAVVIGDKVFTADAVKVSHEAKVKRYYAIGEENPYAAVAGKAVYTIVLHGFSGGEEAFPGEFTLQTGGTRYTYCVLKAASENKLVIEAGACEKITRRTQSGTEA